jgi:hypothetical protein
MAKRRTSSALKKQPGMPPDSFFSIDKVVRRLPQALGFLIGMLLIWVFLQPVDATSVFAGEALPQNLVWMLVGVVAAVTALSMRRRFVGGAQLVLVCAGLVLLFVASVRAGELCNPRTAWFGFWQVASLVGGFYALRCLVGFGDRTRGAVLSVLLVGCIASGFQGLRQVLVEFPEARASYAADPDGEIAKIPGLYAPPGSPQRMRFEDRLMNSREPFAQFALANSLAAILSATLLILGVGLMGSAQRKDWRSMALLGLAFLSTLATWFLASSRVAYIAVAAGAVLAAFLKFYEGSRWESSRRWVYGSLILLGSIFGAGFLLLLQVNRLVITEATKSLGYRMEYWQATLSMIADFPVFGVGLGNFQAHYPAYKLALSSEEIADPHNWILDMGATLGVPFLLLFMCGFGCWYVRNLWSLRTTSAVKAASPETEKSNAVTADLATASADRAVAKSVLWGGGLGGLTCAGLLMLLQGLSPSVLVWAWFPAVVVVACVVSDCQAITGRRDIFLAAVFCIGLCLLITGSWQASGIAVPLMVIMVLAEASPGFALTEIRARTIAFGLLIRLAPCGLAVIGLCAFLVQSWSPVTKAWTLQQQAINEMRLAEQLEKAAEARSTDPMDGKLLGWSGQLLTQVALEAPRSAFERESKLALEQLVAWTNAENAAFGVWRQAGNQTLLLFSRAEQGRFVSREFKQRLLTQAADFYQGAVERYPTSAELHVQLAAVLALRSAWELCEGHVAVAIRLSAETPHEDKRLGRHRTQGDGDQLIWFPVAAARELQESPSVPQMVRAEPLIAWMRNERDAEESESEAILSAEGP